MRLGFGVVWSFRVELPSPPHAVAQLQSSVPVSNVVSASVCQSTQLQMLGTASHNKRRIFENRKCTCTTAFYVPVGSHSCQDNRRGRSLHKPTPTLLWDAARRQYGVSRLRTHLSSHSRFDMRSELFRLLFWIRWM